MIFIGLKKEHISKNDVSTLINFSNVDEIQNVSDKNELIVLNSHKGSIAARTNGQKKYLKAVLNNDVVFAIGPAGTGKTYQGVASAVSSLKKKEVSKIEKVSFIPTLLRYKINPYLYRFFKFTI